MKTKFTILAACIMALALIGCASTNANLFNTEKIATDTAKAATHTFTNGASAAELTRLNNTRDTLYDADRKMSASLIVLDDLRLAYKANSADTNKTAALIALETVSAQSTNIVSLVKSFMNPQAK